MTPLRNPLKQPEAAVHSLNVQAAWAPDGRVRSQFEVMVRHLFDRMLNNEAFGDDALTRMTQLAYAIALPGVLVALFLTPAYHHPPPLHLDRPFWDQAADHLFFVTYAFVVLGTVMVFQWELLFPSLIDVYVLTSLPIPTRRLLLGRLTALTIFLSLVQLETSLLGNLFLPAIADLKTGFWRHVAAHAAGVTLAALCAAAFFIVLQAMLVCLPAKIATRASSTSKVLSVVVLLSILFLFPLVAHSIEQLVPAVRWFPPFWFLGVYETILLGRAAPAIFPHLAATGLAVTAILAALGSCLYPLAYHLRVRRLTEGAGTTRRQSLLAPPLRAVLHTLVVRTPRARAIFHFAALTLLRLQRLHLYLAMYAGAGAAIVLSGLIVFTTPSGHLRIAISPDGIRIAIPVLAFWSVMGLRTALRSPLALQGSWLFRVIASSPSEEELRAPQRLTTLLTTTLTLTAVVALHLLAPAELRSPLVTAAQALVAVGLSFLLSDLAFLPIRAIPFTALRVASQRELPITLVLYLMVFPYFALKVVEHELSIEASWTNLLKTALAMATAHAALTWQRRRILRTPVPVDETMFLGLGLRED